MAKKISDEMKKRLLGQKKAMGTSLIIDNKSFEKGLFHILPAKAGETPGVEYISLYCERIKKGTTSPRTFGLECPVMDALDKIKREGDKEQREVAYNTINTAREYWMNVLDMDDPGTADSPNIKIFRAKRAVYEAIINRMVDDDDGEDITDLEQGRPVRVKKAGAMKETKWTLTPLDRAPISEDSDFVEAVRAGNEALDPRAKFYSVDYDKLAELYMELVGEDMPQHYREQGDGKSAAKASKTVASKPAAAAAKPAAAAAKTAAPAKAAPKSAAKKAEPEPDVNGIILGVTTVSFSDADGNEQQGVAMKVNDDGGYDVEVDGEEWSVSADDVTVVEVAADEEVAPEPEPVKAAPKKAVAKKAAPAPEPEAEAEEDVLPEDVDDLPAKPAPKKAAAAATGVGKAVASMKARITGKK